jgi:hypothetical protein
LTQFQEKCVAVFRPELRQTGEQFQEKCAAVFRPELSGSAILWELIRSKVLPSLQGDFTV